MADTETTPAHRPVPVVGAVIGVVVAFLFALLFAWLGNLGLGSGGFVVSLVLMAAWAVFAAFAYGPADPEDHGEPGI